MRARLLLLAVGWRFRFATAAPVPESIAQVDVPVLNLQDGLHKLQLAATLHLTAAAQDLYTAIRAAADAQFDPHIHNFSARSAHALSTA